MSRDDFDFINLTENLEKNAEEMIREMQTKQSPSISNSNGGTHSKMPGSRETSGYERSFERRPRRRTSSGYEENPRRREVENGNLNTSQADYKGSSSEVRNNGRYQSRGKESRENDMARGREQRGGRRKPSRAEKKLKRKLIKIAIIVLVLFGAVYALVHSMVSKTNYEKLDTDYVRPSDVETVKGVKNILLIGTDARSKDEDGRSDSMIILSINSKNNRIVMTSILRDSYVEIPGHGSNRINAAYSYGQEALLIQTIEQNFKIPIDAYAKVDFFSFIDIVDAVGGVEIDVSEEEMKWVNAYLNETNELLGKEFGDGYLTQSGTQTLTGKQALSYARIRYIGTDFQRTERQREILNAVMNKAKAMGPTGITKIMNTVLPKVTTNIPDSELTMMAMKSVMYMGYDMEQIHLPLDGTWENAKISGMEVLKIDFEANIAGFKEAVYGDKTGDTEETSTEQQ
ncbi:MAG: LCP family protein [Lachnospiraceae bacterium]|nr:LCP family protein [Lachnospiraceae bacterium]